MAARAARAGLAFAAAVALVSAAPGSAIGATRHSDLVKSAHVAFENCPARTTVLTATLLALTFSPNQPILVGVSVRNDSNRACGSNGKPGSLLGGLGVVIGPCGNVAMQVKNGNGHTVFPAPRTTPCPSRSTSRLLAHHALHTVGVWSQQEGSTNATSATAPRGQYRVVLDSKIVFHILLVGTGGTLIPPTVTPTTSPTPGICHRFFNLVAASPTTTKPPPSCPIGQVGGPPHSGVPTPTVPPATTTTATAPGRAST